MMKTLTIVILMGSFICLIAFICIMCVKLVRYVKSLFGDGTSSQGDSRPHTYVDARKLSRQDK